MPIGPSTRRLFDLALVLVLVGAILAAVLASVASWRSTSAPLPAPRVRPTVTEPGNIEIPGPTAPPARRDGR